MTDLEDVFGEDFAQHVQERTADRRQERNRLTEEQMQEVAHLAINEGKFEEGDPQFTYTTDNGITHNILLMQVPDPDNGEVWEHLSEPWEGAARLPIEYLGQWYWSTFPDKQDVASLDAGDHVIVAGSIEEDEGDNGEKYYSIYPVRSVLQLDEAQEFADKHTGDADFETDTEEETETEPEPEPEPEPETEENEEDTTEDDESSGGLNFDSNDSSSGGGLDGLMGDDDEEEEKAEEEEETAPVPYDDIAAVVEELAENQDKEEEPQVYEIEEDSDHHGRLSAVVCNQLDLDDEEAAAEVVIDVIDEHREDDEDEEDETNKLF